MVLAATTLKSLAVWAAILALAIVNGGLREAILVPTLGNTIGLALSGLLLSALIIAVSFATLPWLGVRRIAQLLAVGMGWAALTMVFEFTFGLWQGKTWAVLFDAYKFKGGNVWPLVLLVTALAPCIGAKLRGWA